MISLFKKIWTRIDEPRFHRFLVGIKYIVSLTLGIAFFYFGFTLVEFAHINWMFFTAGPLLAVGSLLGAMFAWSKRWIWERPATFLVTLGLVLTIGIGVVFFNYGSIVTGSITISLSLIYLLSQIDRYVEILDDDYEISQTEVERAATDYINNHIEH